MKTEAFWENVKQMINMTCSSCRVAESQGQSCEEYEKEMLRVIAKKCERQLSVIENQK